MFVGGESGPPQQLYFSLANLILVVIILSVLEWNFPIIIVKYVQKRTGFNGKERKKISGLSRRHQRCPSGCL